MRIWKREKYNGANIKMIRKKIADLKDRKKENRTNRTKKLKMK